MNLIYLPQLGKERIRGKRIGGFETKMSRECDGDAGAGVWGKGGDEKRGRGGYSFNGSLKEMVGLEFGVCRKISSNWWTGVGDLRTFNCQKGSFHLGRGMREKGGVLGRKKSYSLIPGLLGGEAGAHKVNNRGLGGRQALKGRKEKGKYKYM